MGTLNNCPGGIPFGIGIDMKLCLNSFSFLSVRTLSIPVGTADRFWLSSDETPKSF